MKDLEIIVVKHYIFISTSKVSKSSILYLLEDIQLIVRREWNRRIRSNLQNDNKNNSKINFLKHST